MNSTKHLYRIVAAGCVALSLLLPAAQTSAHDSGYCGHGVSGYWNQSVYSSAWTDGQGNHNHWYNHYDWIGNYTHTRSNLCLYVH